MMLIDVYLLVLVALFVSSVLCAFLSWRFAKDSSASLIQFEVCMCEVADSINITYEALQKSGRVGPLGKEDVSLVELNNLKSVVCLYQHPTHTKYVLKSR